MARRPGADGAGGLAIVANRLSDRATSQRAGCKWVAERVFIDGLDAVSDDARYWAMDPFMHAPPGLQEEILFSVANLLNLDVYLLLLDLDLLAHRDRRRRPHP